MAEWLDQADQHGRAEVVDGLVRLEDTVTANRHNVVADLLAQAFRDQWGRAAVSPGNWLLAGDAADVRTARQPDVLVGGAGLLESDAYQGAPDAVVEVWSPSDEMGAKRREYHDGGAPVFVEAYISDVGDVRLDWQVTTDRRGIWRTVAAAAGDSELVVDAPRPFRLVPNDLRGFSALRD